MKFNSLMFKGKFIKRYKRFFADFELNNKVEVAHCANTGTMKTCLGENWDCMVSFHDSPTRKLKYSLEMLHNGKTWIGINTSITNALAIEAIKNGTITELQGYADLKPEAKIGNSRIDILLSNGPTEQCYVEVKNVTLIDENGRSTFPDAVTERGQKHLGELQTLKQNGIRTVMLFVVQREDCSEFSIDQDIDKEYCKLLKEVIKSGVEVLVYQCSLNPEEIKIIHRIPAL